MPKAGNDLPWFSTEGNLLNIGWMSLDPVSVAAGETVLNIHARILDNDQRGLNVEKNIRFVLDENPISELADGDGNAVKGAKILIPDAAPASLNTTGLVSVYPNPASGVLNIEYLMQQAGTFHAELMSMQGNVILKTGEINSRAGFNTTTLDLHGLPTAIYLLKVSYGDYQQTVKVVVNK
jgi:hypothetical protein